MPSSILYRLRSTMADPPGACADDAERAATYRAAMTQFEQLLDSARAAENPTTPPPLLIAAGPDDPPTTL